MDEQELKEFIKTNAILNIDAYEIREATKNRMKIAIQELKAEIEQRELLHKLEILFSDEKLEW